MTNQVNTTIEQAATAVPASIFGAPATETPVETPLVSIPAELASLVGEGKKYKDIPAALSSISPAQEHIKNLESSLKELREDLAKRETTEELLTRLEKKASENASQETPALSTQDLEGLVTKVLDSKVSAKRREDNISLVDTEMKKVYGEKATETLVAKARELSLSVKEMEALAAKSPQAFLAMFRTASTTTSTDRTSSLNTEGVAPVSGEKNFAHFQKLRKENPTLYYSPATQQEMHRKAKEQGSRFYG